MNAIDHASFALARSILASASEMALATLRPDGAPHVSTVSFASEGIALFAAIALDSHKAHDIRVDGRVSLTVNAPYQNWNEYQGLSIDGIATMIDEVQGQVAASALLLKKLPGYAELLGASPTCPWPGMLFIRIAPTALSLFDYTERFGHSMHFDVSPPV